MCAAVARVSGTRLRNRGADDADLARPLAGDGIVPDARSSATVGITIDAPPRAVWDELMEMRHGRGRCFETVISEPEEVLVLRASLRVPSGRPYDPQLGRPRWFSDSTWAFALEPDASGHTRLLVRTRNAARPRFILAAVSAVLWDPARLLLEHQQLRQLRRRAEAGSARECAAR